MVERQYSLVVNTQGKPLSFPCMVECQAMVTKVWAIGDGEPVRLASVVCVAGQCLICRRVLVFHRRDWPTTWASPVPL